MKTIDVIKQKRKVPDELKEKQKEYNRIKKLILQSLESEPKTIPQIAEETKLPPEITTFYVMTLRKYGDIEVDEIDDMDEYFTYRRIGKKSN